MKAEKTKKRLHKYFMVLSLSFFVFIVIAALYYGAPALSPDFKVLQGFEINSVDFRFRLRNYIDKDILKTEKNGIYNRMAIASIDDRTIIENGGWPFDRKVWADALNALSDSPEIPGLTFFDIVFSDPSQRPASDKALKNASKDYKGALGEDIILEPIEGISLNELNSGGEESLETRDKIIIQHALDYNSDRVKALRRFEIRETNNLNSLYPLVSPLLKELPQYLQFLGAANIEARETTSREVPAIPFINPVFYKVMGPDGEYVKTNVYYPSIVLAIALKELKAGLSDVELGNHELTVKNAFYNGRRSDFKIPVDENYHMNINYRSAPGSSYIKKIPFKDLKSAKLPPDCLLFVGMYSKKGSLDLYRSPMGDMFGVEHLSYAVGTVLSRDFLYEVPEWVNLIYILLLTLGAGF